MDSLPICECYFIICPCVYLTISIAAYTNIQICDIIIILRIFYVRETPCNSSREWLRHLVGTYSYVPIPTIFSLGWRLRFTSNGILLRKATLLLTIFTPQLQIKKLASLQLPTRLSKRFGGRKRILGTFSLEISR